ncbi:Hypothetical protein D9617_21g097340 [Elsinoe fawcettii]|nr:Hypothetical protein D9617_21g097340 [Elsinoe fawcettii]
MINPHMIPMRELTDHNVCPNCLAAAGIQGQVVGQVVIGASQLQTLQERDAFIETIHTNLEPARFVMWLHDYLLSDCMRLVGTQYRDEAEATSAASMQEYVWWSEFVRRNPTRLNEAPEWVRRRLQLEWAALQQGPSRGRRERRRRR